MTVVAQTAFEFQASEESSHDAGFDASVWAFTYIVAREHLNWDLSFLGEKLNAQVVAWHDQWRASLPPSDEPPAPPSAEVPASSLSGLQRTSSGEVPAIPPLLEVHREQVIEDDPVVQIEESDGSEDNLEQINDPSGVLDHQDG